MWIRWVTYSYHLKNLLPTDKSAVKVSWNKQNDILWNLIVALLIKCYRDQTGIDFPQMIKKFSNNSKVIFLINSYFRWSRELISLENPNWYDP